MAVTMKEDTLINQADEGKYRVSTPTKFHTPSTSATTCPAASPLSSPVKSSFSFPTFSGDGTTPDLIETHPPPGEVTPPAALSTLGIKMAESKKKSSSELEDGQYDMLDDASEFSADGNETASLASFDEQSSNDGQLTPDDTGSIVDAGELLSEHSEVNDTVKPTSAAHPAALEDYHLQLRLLELQNKKNARMAKEDAAAAHEKSEAEKTEEELESFLTEDLETPRQSTVYRGDASKSDSTEACAVDGLEVPKEFKVSQSSSHKSKAFSVNPQYLGLVLTFISLLTWIGGFVFPVDPAASNVLRKDALDAALQKTTGILDITKTYNTTHLLPVPTRISTNIFGQQEFGVSDVHFQAMPPNSLVVSLPSTDSRIPCATSAQVLKVDKPLAFNQTMLIPGVYKFDFEPKDANGVITVNMQTAKPPLNITVSHNYGRRMFQKQTYETARTDLTKAVNKDVDVARKSAKSLTELLQLELGASVAATKNVTTQVAVNINRDLQLWVSNTASMLTKAAVASNRTYFNVQKDLMRIEQRLDDAGSVAYKRLSSAGAQVAKTVTEPLVLSRERAVALKDKLFGCKQGKKGLRKLKAGKVPSMKEKRAKKKCGKKGGME